MNFERWSVKAVPEAVKRRPTQQSSHCKAVPEGMRSRAPPPPEGTPLQIWPTWPGSPNEPPVEVEEMKVEDLTPDPNSGATHAWKPRERAIVRRMEDYFAKGKCGIFKDVRFYPILNFGHFWAPSFSECFFAP